MLLARLRFLSNFAYTHTALAFQPFYFLRRRLSLHTTTLFAFFFYIVIDAQTCLLSGRGLERLQTAAAFGDTQGKENHEIIVIAIAPHHCCLHVISQKKTHCHLYLHHHTPTALSFVFITADLTISIAITINQTLIEEPNGSPRNLLSDATQI